MAKEYRVCTQGWGVTNHAAPLRGPLKPMCGATVKLTRFNMNPVPYLVSGDVDCKRCLKVLGGFSE